MKKRITSKQPKKAENRGGAREGAGRKEGAEETVLINFRVRESLRDKVKEKFPVGLNKKFVDFLESIV
jgi:hypothetical protein